MSKEYIKILSPEDANLLLSEDICPVLRWEIKRLQYSESVKFQLDHAEKVKLEAQIKANLTNKSVTIDTPYHINYKCSDGNYCIGMFVNREETQDFINDCYDEEQIQKSVVRVCDYGHGCVRNERVLTHEVVPMNRDYVNSDGTPNHVKIQHDRAKLRERLQSSRERK